MMRSRSTWNLPYLLSAAGLTLVACSEQASETNPETVVPTTAAAKNFCGNGRCDHMETCSSCPLDCGSCSGTGGSTGSGGSSGSGGSTGVCGSTAAPPARYDHVVIFSFE